MKTNLTRIKKTIGRRRVVKPADQGKVRKWGNSAAILLPKHVTHAGHLAIGTDVQFEVRPEGVLMRRVRRRPTLEELLKGVTPENVDRVSWDDPQGNEIL
jgi:antitoxin MazE